MNNNQQKIAIIGATGMVGRQTLSILSELKFPKQQIIAIASTSSRGKKISYGSNQELEVISLEDYNFLGTDYAIFATDDEISRKFIPIATQSGCIVIDDSSCYRQTHPLVISEVNPEAIELALSASKENRIIANPNCVVIQLLTAVWPLHKQYKIKRMVIATYQSVSGAGKEGMDELFDQTRALLMNSRAAPKVFPKQIAFNCIPQVGNFTSSGNTTEEEKIRLEVQKILAEEVEVSINCCRVPVFIGHSIALNIEFHLDVTPKAAVDLLEEAEGVVVISNKGPTPYVIPSEVVLEDAVYVSRVRQDPSRKNALNLWITTDNVNKGGALNAVQTLGLLIEKENRDQLL